MMPLITRRSSTRALRARWQIRLDLRELRVREPDAVSIHSDLLRGPEPQTACFLNSLMGTDPR